ncbi:structure-specific endonuclease subunit SLX1 [Aspergillus clavatus NRRL 1]|uniref:Structure-specific endonuclease subunit slx1 n=1 Tax=Aspergillus clavatus (strain ATCC 1007 / CBS 513.65 / DSM 816 / NCTC 3887 / NRRL 1 / QM 1276 / 107) TaxID=344612 RepID=SLX1_ASPCL|nr:GIY-YIG catalytic domain protein [Aspergillus clavatus NRRL 1]A1C4Z4.1 RecName: Full=Structure-specific endonuclease subunit slx1 [Aspergillus clavatus NRRL 1]EAW14762.1 GIY-YIG catalytic domain protein [Aspergillus clavatus NRRL 1]
MENIQLEHSKPIPAFYCCYLLRSTVRHASLYIGSTPNPARRLTQHNGVVKGGARRTAAEKLRPWEMVMIVEGFMSRLGALQFEWAWQNPGYSRHLRSEEEGLEAPGTTSTTKPKTTRRAKSQTPQPLEFERDPSVSKSLGTPKRKNQRRRRPQRSLTTHFADLHRLLQSPYFSNWPLRIRFFSADVYQSWKAWYDRVDIFLPGHVNILLDGSCPENSAQCSAVGARFGSVEQAKVNYDIIQDYLEKAMFLLDDPKDLSCRVCQTQIAPKEQLAVVCPQAGCHCTCHLLCLSKKFLDAMPEPDCLIPRHGACPACKATVQWSLMMQELSFRSRGEQEALAILKRKRRLDRRQQVISKAKCAGKGVDSSDVRPTSVDLDRSNNNASDDLLLDDDWFDEFASESDSDTGHRSKALSKAAPNLETVVEDSEGDDLEFL